MFAWPTCELTEYELKYVRYYKQPQLDAQGKPTGKVWPGVLKRVYNVQLYNQNIPEIARFNNGPVFDGRVLISRRSRVFGFTFSGDVGNWYLDIQTAGGERFTNQPCLVSAMTAGSYYNYLSSLGSPGALPGEAQFISRFWQGNENFGVMVEPNYQLLPNETLIFSGSLPRNPDGEEVWPEGQFTQLSIGIHVWEFPGMGYSETKDGRAV